MRNLIEAAKAFNQYLESYEKFYCAFDKTRDVNKILIKFLIIGGGFRHYVKSYEDLCELAVFLQSRGHKNMTNPPATKMDFILAIDSTHHDNFGKQPPVIPFDVSKIHIAAMKFDIYMGRQQHPNIDNYNKTLIKFLNYSGAFFYIKTYEELCELAVFLNSKGYKSISNPPCDVDEYNSELKSWVERRKNVITPRGIEKPLFTISRLDSSCVNVLANNKNIFFSKTIVPSQMIVLNQYFDMEISNEDNKKVLDFK